MSRGEPRQRLFIALWPDAAVRARLAQVAREQSPRPVAAANLHMTLHFLGACTAEQQDCYSSVVSTITCKPFELSIDYLGAWRASGTQWLGCSRHPPALLGLVEGLGRVLAGCGYKVEKKHYVPHITISRHSKKLKIKTGLPAISWMVREFVLAESVADDRGVRYLVRARWACR